MANESQFSGGSQTVALENIVDDQAALAAQTAIDPTASAQQPATLAAAAVVATSEPATPKEVDELSPAAKQAALADDQGEIGLDMFKAQSNRSKQKAPDSATKLEATQAAATATPAATQQLPATRDVSVLPAEYQEAAKKMSNEAFGIFTKLVEERKTLGEQLSEAKKGALPDSYFEHEQAYVLTPEFATASDNVTQAETVLSHWSQQADALAAGADSYTMLVQGANGQLVQSAPIKADRTTVNQINRAVTWAQQQYMTAQASLQAVGQTHKARAAETKNWVDNFERSAFKVFDERPEYKALVSDTKAKLLHKSLHGNILASAFAKAVILLDHQARTLAQQTAGGAAPAATQQQPARAVAQPSAAAIAGGGVAAVAKAGSNEDVTMDDFYKAKKGML